MSDRAKLGAELNRLELKHRSNFEARRRCEPMLPMGILSIARELLAENEEMRESMRAIQQTIPSRNRWTHNELARWVGPLSEDEDGDE